MVFLTLLPGRAVIAVAGRWQNFRRLRIDKRANRQDDADGNFGDDQKHKQNQYIHLKYERCYKQYQGDRADIAAR